MIDIFTGLLGVIAVCTLLGTTFRIFFAPPKVWDDYDDQYEGLEESVNHDKLREQNPHIWMD